jgi:glycosyltransferase involved in cell wall biosynthesis
MSSPVAKVSIIITCYNYGRFLMESVSSALAQTYNDVEVIIIDDGSTDDTPTVVQNWQSEPRVRYFRQRNGGISSALNAGVRMATGEFVAFLDADDRWDPRKLEKQMSRFQDSKVGVVYTESFEMSADEKGLRRYYGTRYLAPRKGWVTPYLVYDNFVPFSSAVVRKECFDKAGNFDESIKASPDFDFWLRVAVHYPFDFVDEPLVFYRTGHADQVSRNWEMREVWCDQIRSAFKRAHPTIVPRRLWRHADAYRATERGHYWLAHDDHARARKLYCESILTYPLQIGPYKGLVKSLFSRRLTA